jgi:hypothetical protein
MVIFSIADPVGGIVGSYRQGLTEKTPYASRGPEGGGKNGGIFLNFSQ